MQQFQTNYIMHLDCDPAYALAILHDCVYDARMPCIASLQHWRLV